MLDLELRQELMAVARGERPAQLFFRGGTVVNVYSGELWPANVAVHRGRIAYVGARETGLGAGTTVVAAAGRLLCPGLVEPHTHPFVLYNPATFVGAALSHGTTAMFCDNLALVQGWDPAGFHRFLDDALGLPAYVRWLARPDAGSQLTAAPAGFTQAAVQALLAHPAVVALSEFDWQPLYRSSPHLLACIAAAEAAGRRVEGHTPGAGAERLSTLVAAGLTSDHEAITAPEVLDRLRLGLWVMLRHSSLRPDLPETLAAVTAQGADTRRLMLTADGATAAHMAEHGGSDGLIRTAVRLGVPPLTAIQMATVNPATYYRVEHDIGGISPGRRADILILDSLDPFAAAEVYSAGARVAAGGELFIRPDLPWARYGSPLPYAPADRWADTGLYRLPAGFGPAVEGGEVTPVVDLVSDVITRRRNLMIVVRDGHLDLAAHPDLVQMSLIRPDAGSVVRGLVQSLAPGLQGFASSFNVAGHLAALGRCPADMALAAARVAALGGGMVLAEGGRILWELPLPILGMMSTAPMPALAAAERQLLTLFRERGFRYRDILYCLNFLPGDFLPKIRITPRGVLDLATGQVLRPPEVPGAAPDAAPGPG